VQVTNHLRGTGGKMPGWLKPYAIGYEPAGDDQPTVEKTIESPAKSLGSSTDTSVQGYPVDPINNNSLTRSDLTRRFVISIISGVGLAFGFSVGYAVVKMFKKGEQ